MTAGLGEQAVGGPALDRAAVRTFLAITALGVGLTAAWLARGGVVVLGALAVIVAAGNGYGKAYSP